MERMSTVSIRTSKPGLGRGLFANRPIASGDFVAEYTGVHIPTPYADTLETRYLFEIDSDWTIDGSSRANVARYINHSCEPNCEGEIRGLPAPRSSRQAGGRVLIYAARDIRLGEELTLDYGDEYFDEFIRPQGCKCVRCAVSS
ncbi:hypothetical protein A3A39_04975 [Candidatus Kaiserbacteria bacterium RIFCSPLOWO2_01_FULL_54_13]|uniref:SET domain-containing protein n=1 Tax=Candidatus Kaiserbacteria bacterium RIFCSPLOWO2_01_FULL_54_13 TaxID=1798512 RepID=A0A1F6F010_9BACT|nr:MAG: hypothetical protein A3A39_04975 [Candidatus Kaiserbacteria bacterium RIFCSPLOWO2_01_FULL_54_13]